MLNVGTVKCGDTRFVWDSSKKHIYTVILSLLYDYRFKISDLTLIVFYLHMWIKDKT